MDKLQQQFEGVGGSFISSIELMSKKAQALQCIIFDWDGVFNDGYKPNDEGSPFGEPDSMGQNMLRYALYLREEKIPLSVIITGANNRTALRFAEREHFQAVCLNFKNKKIALKNLQQSFDLKPENCLFVFDDILDISLAKLCGFSICVKRKGSPLFTDYITKNNLADYVTGNPGGKHAVREISELIIGLLSAYDKIIEGRVAFEGSYENYLSKRNQENTFLLDAREL